MFSTWFPYSLFLALLVSVDVRGDECRTYEVEPGKDSPVLDSLQCYNNYKSHVDCTWEVDPRLHPQANFSMNKLYFKDPRKINKKQCIASGSNVFLSNGKIAHTCRYETKRFGTNTRHILTFEVPCASRHTTHSIAEQGKVRAPVDLTEMETDDGACLLSWRSPCPESSNITKTLVYQLQYRRRTHDWTTVNNINVSEHTIDNKSLLSGYDYEARVRARGPIGLWSDWSPLVSWRTQDDGVFNLQCLIEGETTVTCTWQMKTDYLPFTSHHIWCSDSNNNQPYKCCESPQLVSSGVELSEIKCSVENVDPYTLTVELRPVKYTRTFKTWENIKLPKPENIQVVEEDGFLKLNWSEPDVNSYILFETEINISSSEASKIYTSEETENNFQLPTPKPLTDLWAQIRFVNKSVDNFNESSEEYYDYVAHPSEWSDPVAFTRKPVSSLNPVFYTLAVPVLLVLIVVMFKSLPVCHRSIMLWKGSIPSPIKSKVVLEGMIKKYPTGWPYLESENEQTSVCVLLAADNMGICKSSNQSLIRTEDAEKKLQAGESNHSHDYVKDDLCKDKSGMSFSGPYIFCCEDTCVQDKALDGSPDQDHTHVSAMSVIFTPVNGGYVVTPTTAMPATQNSAPDETSTNDASAQPPVYTPSPDPECAVIPHPSGYFTMPCVATDQLQPKGYVTLANNET